MDAILPYIGTSTMPCSNIQINFLQNQEQSINSYLIFKVTTGVSSIVQKSNASLRVTFIWLWRSDLCKHSCKIPASLLPRYGPLCAWPSCTAERDPKLPEVFWMKAIAFHLQGINKVRGMQSVKTHEMMRLISSALVKWPTTEDLTAVGFWAVTT